MEHGRRLRAAMSRLGRQKPHWALALVALAAAASIWYSVQAPEGTTASVRQISASCTTSHGAATAGGADGANTPGQGAKRGSRRTLSVLSCRERLANALQSFGEVMTMAEVFDFELVLPFVNNSEIGAGIVPVYGQPQERRHLFETYFNVSRISQSYGRFARIKSYAHGVPSRYAIDHLIIFSFRNDTCVRVHQLLHNRHLDSSVSRYAIHCVPVPSNMEDLRAIFDGVCSGAASCNVALYEWPKQMWPQLGAAAYQKVMWASFHRDIDRLAKQAIDPSGATGVPPPYIAAQFRSGFFFRFIDLTRDKTELLVTFAERDAAMRSCLDLLIQSALAARKRHGTERIYLASDLFGTVPESFRDPDLQSFVLNALSSARRHVSLVDSIHSTSLLNYSTFQDLDHDPHTLSTMLDVQIALNSAELVTIARSGTYSGLTAATKQLLGGAVSYVNCNTSKYIPS